MIRVRVVVHFDYKYSDVIEELKYSSLRQIHYLLKAINNNIIFNTVS